MNKINSKLYKYRNFDAHALDILKKNEIWCSHASQFNDPFEFTVNIGYEFTPDSDNFRELLIDRHKSSIKNIYDLGKITHAQYMMCLNACNNASHDTLLHHHDEVCKFFEIEAKKLVNSAKDNFRVFSLSQSDDHPLLWGHYADGVRGFCIEFDFSKMNFPILEVQYTKAPPTLYESKLRNEKSSNHGIHDDSSIYDIFRYKHESWNYEREARLLVSDSDLETNKNTLKLKEGSIKSITIGSLMNDKNKNTLISIANEKKIPIYFATPIPSEYKIKITREP